MIKLYGLKNCDTCRKAIKTLTSAGIDHKAIDVRADGVSKTQLMGWSKIVGWEKLLNTRSTTWRGLPETDKTNLNEKKAVALMAEYPALMKRPLVEKTSKQVFVGWTKDTQDAIIG